MKENKGITTISLVITIIVMLILASVVIKITVDEGGLVDNAKVAQKEQLTDSITERIQLEIIKYGQDIPETNLKLILEKYGLIQYEENGDIKGIIIAEGYEIPLIDIMGSNYKKNESPTPVIAILKNGKWDGNSNSPKIDETGLMPVYWDNNVKKYLTNKSTQEEWDNWYDYSNALWANAESADGSLWVWIPRYEYRINSNKSIDVNFIKTDKTQASDGFIIHPSFTSSIENGGWATNKDGFWMAKYEAGYEEVGQETYSNLNYTSIKTDKGYNIYEKITVNETFIPYPVFKENKYSFNMISVGDAWRLSREIGTSNNYGLSNVESHLTKDSEWGAVAYLTQSSYGRNGNSSDMNEMDYNAKTLNNSIYVQNAETGNKANICGMTGYGEGSEYNDVAASTTNNITGIFDLSGGSWEMTASYMKNKQASNIIWHKAMATNATSASTEYVTLYSANNKLGDATNETSGWNSDYCDFMYQGYPVMLRGGWYGATSHTGIFCFSRTTGEPANVYGFRVCLVS